jgi:hypothetical protein
MALAQIGSLVSRRASSRFGQVGAIRAASQTPLPWKFHSFSGFRVETEIKDSLIPGAGLGRFTTVPVKAGEIIRGDPLLRVSEYVKTSHTLKDTVAIDMKNGEDMDDMVSHWHEQAKADGKEKSEVRTMMSWFMAGVPSERTDRVDPLVYVLAHSFHTNHGFPNPGNMMTVVEDGFLYHKAARDIAVGEELVLDYLAMGIKPFAKRWCAQYGLVDVETLAVNIEGSYQKVANV